MRRGVGDYGKASIKAIQIAEAYQGLAVDYISRNFKTEEAGLRLEDLSYGDFVKALIEAEESGKRAEFEADLAAKLVPILQAVMAPPQQQPQGQ